MKRVIFILIAIAMISSCKCIKPIAPLITDCPISLPVANQSHTIFLDCDPNSHDHKLCLLKNSHSEQTVELISSYNRDKFLNSNIKRTKSTEISNLIALLKSLTVESIDKFAMPIKLSNWMLVYLVITSSDEFICENGVMRTQDFARLDYIMNKYWHKFKVMRVGVVFPNSCKHKMVIYDGKRKTNQSLYDRSIKLIDATDHRSIYDAFIRSGQKLTENYPLRATIFDRIPTSILDCKKMHYYIRNYNTSLSGGFCGLDGMVMHDIVTYFKFNVFLHNSGECSDFGYVSFKNNTTASGSLGCIIRNETDVSFNGRFVSKYYDDNLLFLHYVTTDALCVLVKKTDIVPLWQGTFNLYSTWMWLYIISVLVMLGVIMWATAVISQKITGEERKPVFYYLFDAVRTSFFGYTSEKFGHSRILRGTSLISAILFGSFYQGHINRTYTTLQSFKSIKTLDELYKSGITLYTSPSMVEFVYRQILDPENMEQREFFNNIHILNSGRFETVIQMPKAATLERVLDVSTIIHSNCTYLDHDSTPLIDVVDECLGFYYLAYIVSKVFPFYEEMTMFIQRMREAGLPGRYYKWTQQMLNVPEHSKVRFQGDPRPYTKISLGDLRVPFGILFVGHIASIIVFFAEILWKQKKGMNLKTKICCGKL